MSPPKFTVPFQSPLLEGMDRATQATPPWGCQRLHLAGCIRQEGPFYICLPGRCSMMDPRIGPSLTCHLWLGGEMQDTAPNGCRKELSGKLSGSLQVFSLPSFYWKSDRVHATGIYRIFIKRLLCARHYVELKFTAMMPKGGGDRHNHASKCMTNSGRELTGFLNYWVIK